MVFKIDIMGPLPFKNIGGLSASWKLDSNQPDFGLRDFVIKLGVVLSDQADAAAIKDKMMAAVRSKIDRFLNEQHFDVGPIHVASLAADWARWDRGDHVLIAALDWITSDPQFAAVLPTSAELRFDRDGNPDVRLPPLDTAKFRDLLAAEVAARLPDASVLNQIVESFGDVAAQSIPSGWLRLRFAVLTTNSLKAEVSFSIAEPSS